MAAGDAARAPVQPRRRPGPVGPAGTSPVAGLRRPLPGATAPAPVRP